MLVDLFEKILSMSLTGCYIILVVLAVRLLLRICGRKYSFFLWFVVLVNLCLPITIQGPFSLVPNAPVVREMEGDIPGNTYTEPAAAGNEQDNIVVNTNTAPVEQPIHEPDMIQPENPTPVKADRLHLSRQTVCSFVWISVLAVVWSVTAYNAWKLNRQLKMSKGTETILDDGIVCVRNIDAPFLWGVLKPTIYIPADIEQEEKEYILAHESFHKKRLDHITKLIFFIVATVHWFNPLVWLAYVLFVRDMEISCDEAVLLHAVGDIKKQYANSLLKYAARQNGYVLSPLTFGEPSLKSRINNVLKFKKKGVLVTAFAICLVVFAGCGLIWRSQPEERAEDDTLQQIELPISSEFDDYPAYFRLLLADRRDEGAYEELLGRQEPREDITLEDGTFDLGESVDSTFVEGVFYDEEEPQAYAVVSGIPHGTWVVSFSPETPQEYTVISSSDMSTWFGQWMRIGDNLCCISNGAGSIPYQVNLRTGEARSCDIEYDTAKAVIADFADEYERTVGICPDIHWYNAMAQVGDVEIYRGSVQEQMDTPHLATVYAAFRDREFVAAMLVDERTGEVRYIDVLPEQKVDKGLNPENVVVERIPYDEVLSQSQMPEWFQIVLNAREEGRSTARDFGWEYSVLPAILESTGEDVFEDSGDVTPNTDYLYECWIKLEDGTLLENLRFDLSEPMKENAWWRAFSTGVFYREDLNRVYITLPVTDINSGVMVLAFSPDAPNEYEIHTYRGMSVWFGESTMVGNDICLHGANGTAPWKINIESWEIYHCEQELEDAKVLSEKYAEEYEAANGVRPAVDWFYASGRVGDVDVYTGYVDETEAARTVACMYTAYQGGDFIGAMLVDENTKTIHVINELP